MLLEEIKRQKACNFLVTSANSELAFFIFDVEVACRVLVDF